MSHRPRFGGDGRLRLTAWVTVAHGDTDEAWPGDIRGEHGLTGWDPFGRTEGDLLLAEAFARFDFERPRNAQRWFAEHGVLDLARLFPDDLFEPDVSPVEGDRFHDGHEDLLRQQALVRWHLLSLARLSTQREEAQPPRPGWEPHEGWDPAWAQPVLADPVDGTSLWLGGRSLFESRIEPDMREVARYEDRHPGVPRDRLLASLAGDDLGGWATPAEYIDEWWPTAHATWRRLLEDEVPVLWVPQDGWLEHWAGYARDKSRPSGRLPSGRLSADWHGLLELERRLIEPFVRQAARDEVHVRRQATSSLGPEGEGLSLRLDGPIVVEERRWWTSVLAPIYLQLVEALRRISEGTSGAAFCGECGQPFLTLDARRTTFCNNLERLRNSQRAHRRRRASRLRGTS
jgi:hypothetical protein